MKYTKKKMNGDPFNEKMFVIRNFLKLVRGARG